MRLFFPFVIRYSTKLDIKNASDYNEQKILILLEEYMITKGAEKIRIEDKTLFFRCSFLGGKRNYTMIRIEKGEIFVFINRNQLTIRYTFSMFRVFIYLNTMCPLIYFLSGERVGLKIFYPGLLASAAVWIVDLIRERIVFSGIKSKILNNANFIIL
jgi:hypothetical protein